VERGEDPLTPCVHVHHRLEQRIDDEMPAVVQHAIEHGAVGLDPVQHAVYDPGDALLELFDPSRRERRHQQAADAGMLLAVHLRHELRVHDLVELLPARTARHLRCERLRIRENLVDVGVTADHHLRLAIAQHVERRPPRPIGHMHVRVRLELGAPKINVDDVALVQICR
jgi:hypothetical protein